MREQERVGTISIVSAFVLKESRHDVDEVVGNVPVAVISRTIREDEVRKMNHVEFDAQGEVPAIVVQVLEELLKEMFQDFKYEFSLDYVTELTTTVLLAYVMDTTHDVREKYMITQYDCVLVPL